MTRLQRAWHLDMASVHLDIAWHAAAIAERRAMLAWQVTMRAFSAHPDETTKDAAIAAWKQRMITFDMEVTAQASAIKAAESRHTATLEADLTAALSKPLWPDAERPPTRQQPEQDGEGGGHE